MDNLHTLISRRTELSRAARNLVAEKGARAWTSAEQAAFNALADETERTDALIEIRNAGGPSPAVEWARDRTRFDNFLRGKAPGETTVIVNTMGTVAGGQGGYTVSSLVASDLVNILKGYGWMRQVASQITTTTGGYFEYPTSDGTSEVGERLAENAQTANLDPSFGLAPLPTTKYSSKVITVPIELLQDAAVDIVSFVLQRATERIGRQQNIDFTIGTGTNQPTGVITAAGLGKLGTTGQTTSIIYGDIVDLADSVDEAALGMPSRQADVPAISSTGWMMSQAMRKVVRRVVDGNGRPIWLPASGSSPPMLLDYPVHINNDMAVPAASAKTLAFGALSKYMIRDALSEIQFLRMADSTFTKNGQVGFLAFARSGGNLLDTSAVRVYQHSAT